MNGDPTTEIASIQEVMRTDIDAYQRDEAMQSRYGELLRAQEAGEAPPSVAAAERELAELRQLMADQSGPYWRGPQAERNQRRYRELLQRQAPSPPLADNDNGGLLKIPPGATETDLAAFRGAADVLRNMPAQARTSFEQRFNALPAAVCSAAAAVLAAPKPYASPVSPADLQKFAAAPEGQALVREWGHDAASKLGVLRARMERWIGAIPVEAQGAAIAWLEEMTVTEVQAIYRAVT